jgi:Ring hydroxylating beta subunit
LHREVTPLGDLAILEEDKRYLEMRVARLETGMAWAEDPPSRTRHLVGNLEATPLENGEVSARTAFLVSRSHLETDHQLLSGSREDVLRNANPPEQRRAGRLAAIRQLAAISSGTAKRDLLTGVLGLGSWECGVRLSLRGLDWRVGQSVGPRGTLRGEDGNTSFRGRPRRPARPLWA